MAKRLEFGGTPLIGIRRGVVERKLDKRTLMREIKKRLESKNKDKFVLELLQLIMRVAKEERLWLEMLTLFANAYTFGPKPHSRKSYIEYVADMAEKGVKRWSGQK